MTRRRVWYSEVWSRFTLTFSTTDGSSTPSSIFDYKLCDESKMNAFSNQVKKLVIKGCALTGTDDMEKARCKNAMQDHKW